MEEKVEWFGHILSIYKYCNETIEDRTEQEQENILWRSTASLFSNTNQTYDGET